MKALQPVSSFVCASCRRARSLNPAFTSASRPLSSTARTQAAGDLPSDDVESTLGSLSNSKSFRRRANASQDPFRFNDIMAARGGPPEASSNTYVSAFTVTPPHRLHVYATKHNTHITFTSPHAPSKPTTKSSSSSSRADRDAAPQAQQQDSLGPQEAKTYPLLSLSAGNIGFRKAARGSYDAAYQLAAFVLKQIQERGLLRDEFRLEVVLRGFGAGREAVSKALLGQEGRVIRNRIAAVVDATRLKFGGPRSPKPRRLG